VLGIRKDSWRRPNNVNHLRRAGILENTQVSPGIPAGLKVTMPLLSDEAMVQTAEQRASFRLTNVSSKLSRSETERFDALAKRRGQQRGELIRRLILNELSRDGGEPASSVELSEIVGLRLMLTNVLKPIATGQKITPEVFDGIMTEVKKRKRAVAVEARLEAERA
jgi:hypothetical protein